MEKKSSEERLKGAPEETLLELLMQKFDRIYVLNLVNRRDRRELIERQLWELGLPQPDMTPFIRYHYATPFPYNGIIADAFNRSGRGRFTKANEYDCSRNHYSIVKICYELGLKHVLIIEDDVLLLKDPGWWADYLNAMPEDYDICQGGGFTTDPRIREYRDADKDAAWFKHKKVGLWNASFYALSRRGMEFYLTYMDGIKFWVADGPLYKAPLSDTLINTYASHEPMAIQADKRVIASDIRDETNDRIDYANDNVYEQDIDMDNYFKL